VRVVEGKLKGSSTAELAAIGSSLATGVDSLKQATRWILDADAGDQGSFYSAKIATTQYHVTQILPRGERLAGCDTQRCCSGLVAERGAVLSRQ
jgi:hypothetical protein